jgi:peptide/nickel transport system ATP-binding protein
VTAHLDVRGLTVEFATRRGPARAVADVSFSLERGQRLGLVGESGSGKSTTVLALMRMIRPPGRIAAGEARLGGDELLSLSPQAMRRVRFARLALIPQGAMNSLNPVLTVAAQIADLYAAHGRSLAGGEARRSALSELLASVGLDEHVADRYPHQLSGGMKQRVCIAMAIALGPEAIIADEPTSALDVIVQKQVLQTLIDAQEKVNAAVILVGHDMGLMAQFADLVGVMYAGRIVEIGPVGRIFADARHPYTRLLIASLPDFTKRGVFRGIPGVAPSIVDPPPGCPFHVRCPRAEAICSAEAPPEIAIAPGHRARCHFAEETRRAGAA